MATQKDKVSPKKTVIGIIVIFLVLLGGIFFYHLYDVNKVNKLTITTNPISELPPHPHNPGEDSIEARGHHILTHSDEFITKEDMWIRGFNVNVVNANGNIIHHLYLGRTDKKDSLCPNYDWQALFVTSEVNMRAQLFFADYGMFIPKGTPLKIFAMLHNPDLPLGPGRKFKKVSAKVTVYYQKNSPFVKHTPVEYHRMHLSDRPCENEEQGEVFAVPSFTPHYTKENSSVNGISTSSYTFPTSGTIIGVGGHFHPFEGGRNVELLLNNRLLYTFTAVEQDSNGWKVWDTPIFPQVFRVNKNDTISIKANYSNDNPYSVKGAMGMGVFYFAPDN